MSEKIPDYGICKAVTDKYDIVKLIARTAHSQVYIVQHKLLKELRAAKVVRKAGKDYERIFNEAFLVKQFKHPGIPLIYDIEEDSNSICIIEEYICGKSLTEYVSEYGKLSAVEAAEYGIRICSILEYLHEYNEKGIVHLDLKPDNILIDDNNNVKIIDFDNSICNGQRTEKQYGSAGYAAPEQYYKNRFDCTADIYSMGMLLMYMIQGGHVQSSTEDSFLYHNELYPIIRKCIRHNRVQRFYSVKKIKKELIKVLMQNQKDYLSESNVQADKNYCCKIKESKQISSITKKSYCIYVYGTVNGMGTTHISLCIAAFVARNNKSVVIIEKSGKKDVIGEALKGKLKSDGTYAVDKINILPDYGDGIQCNVDNYDFKVYDCGTYEHYMTLSNIYDNQKLSDMKENCLRVLVTDAGYGMRYKNSVIKKQEKGTVVAVNHTSGEKFYQYTRNQNMKIHFVRIPCVYNYCTDESVIDYAVWEILSEKFPGMFNVYGKKGEKAFLYRIKRLFFKGFNEKYCIKRNIFY